MVIAHVRHLEQANCGDLLMVKMNQYEKFQTCLEVNQIVSALVSKSHFEVENTIKTPFEVHLCSNSHSQNYTLQK